jgi:hypothetical protein
MWWNLLYDEGTEPKKLRIVCCQIKANAKTNARIKDCCLDLLWFPSSAWEPATPKGRLIESTGLLALLFCDLYLLSL